MLAAREADLLPVGYFHIVFTLPAQIAEIAFQSKVAVYDLLYRHAFRRAQPLGCHLLTHATGFPKACHNFTSFPARHAIASRDPG